MKKSYTILLYAIVCIALFVASCIDNAIEPNEKKLNAAKQMNERVTRPDTIYADVATKALLNQFPVGLRKWGMRITVTDDPTSGNNCEWVLVKSMSSNDKSDNDNWAPTTIEIGAWNMDTTTSITVAFGFSNGKAKIRAIHCTIIPDDAILNYQDLKRYGDLTWDNNNVYLTRFNGDHFDSPAYDNAAMNRGWVYIQY